VIESPGGACTRYSIAPDHPVEGTAPNPSPAKAALEARLGGTPQAEPL
jgi:hypothetical protein